MNNDSEFKREDSTTGQQETKRDIELNPQPEESPTIIKSINRRLINCNVGSVRDADGFVIPTISFERKTFLPTRRKQENEPEGNNKKRNISKTHIDRGKVFGHKMENKGFRVWDDSDYAFNEHEKERNRGDEDGTTKNVTPPRRVPPIKLPSLPRKSSFYFDDILDEDLFNSDEEFVSLFDELDDDFEYDFKGLNKEKGSTVRQREPVINKYNEEGSPFVHQKGTEMSRKQKNEETDNVLWEVPKLEDFTFEPDEKPKEKAPLLRCYNKIFHNVHLLSGKRKAQALNQAPRLDNTSVSIEVFSRNITQSMHANSSNKSTSNLSRGLDNTNIEKKGTYKDLGSVAKKEGMRRLKTVSESHVKKEDVNNINVVTNELNITNNRPGLLKRCNSTGTNNLIKKELYMKMNRPVKKIVFTKLISTSKSISRNFSV